MLESMIVDEAEKQRENYEETLIESTDVTDPIEYTVYVSIDTVKVEVELVSNLQMHLIIKLIGSALIQLITKNPTIVLRQCTKLIVLILKLEISQANLVDNLFPEL